MQTKICSSCKDEKSVSEFSASNSYRDGYRGQCKVCRASYTSRYLKRPGYVRPKIKDTNRKNYPSYSKAERRNTALRTKYGIATPDYNKMLAEQKNKCAVCETSAEQTRTGKLYVDHCHLTGRVRGLLCQRCNFGLGFFDDKIEVLRRAITYLS